MIYRKLTASGDYTFGGNAQDFYSGLQACSQAIKTRLQLFQNTFWRDLSDGVPYFQQILATSGSQTNLTIVGTILQNRIIGTPGVTEITQFATNFDTASRTFSATYGAQTIYSVTVTGTITA